MSAPTIEIRAISTLSPYERNARTHSPEQVKQLADSIAEFGFTNPILVSPEGTIIAGHGRLEAAKALGLTEVPTLTVGGDWSEDQLRAYILADNQLALNAGWDKDLLSLELRELSEIGFNLDLIGFPADQLAAALAEVTIGQTDPDEVPDQPLRPITKPGDIWILGKHRIICGDSTDAETVARLLDGEKPHLMVTDPPYGVEYDPNWRNEAARTSEGMGNRALGAGAVGKVLNDDKADWREAWALFPGDVAYVWHAGLYAATVAESLEACGLMLRSQIIWDKTRLVIGRGDYHWHHEPCWYAVRKGKKGHWAGDRKQTTVWPISHQKSETGHGTQKPVECMKRPIENNSEPGDAVYEPFSGSGTTIIAGEMTGRRVYACELNPAYVDVAIMRWQTYSGKLAIFEGDGSTFQETIIERGQ